MKPQAKYFLQLLRETFADCEARLSTSGINKCNGKARAVGNAEC